MNKMLPDEESVNLLWTGGWDSTFQLLQLLLVHLQRVTPFYVIDPERRSTGMELLTMKHIKDHLWNEYPHTRRLLQPTRYCAVEDVSQDCEIAEAFQYILKEKYIGDQYDWLARFCKSIGITDMQLCIHLDDKAHIVIEQIVSESTDGFQGVFRVDPRFKDMNEYVLFQYFSFPLFELSKTQMSTIADRQGWEKIMHMTWFCQKPANNMKPCGKCKPCLYTIQEGLGWRIPVRSRIVSYFYRQVIWPLRSVVKIVIRKLGLLKYIQKST